jgi:Rad3-related DNA helicase
MEIFKEAKRFFPFEAFRPGQEQLLKQLCEAIEEGKKLVLLCAPPGVGKTSVVLSAAAALLRLQPLGKPRAYYLTPTRALAEQVLAEAKADRLKASGLLVKMLKGYEAYACKRVAADAKLCRNCPYKPRRLSRPVKGGVEARKCWLVPRGEMCQYWADKTEALKADIVVMTKAYYLYERRFCGDLPRPRLIIVDEAHSLADQLAEMSAVELNVEHSFSEHGEVRLSDVLRGLYVAKKVLEQRVKQAADFNASAKLGNVKSDLKAVKRLLKACREVAVKKDPYSGKLKLIPLDLTHVYSEFFDADHVISLSSTIGPFEGWRRLAGLSDARIAQASAESNIPVENRPFYALNDGVHVSHVTLHTAPTETSSLGDATVGRLAELVKKFMTFNVKVVVHPLTIELGKRLLQKLTDFQELLVTHVPLMAPIDGVCYRLPEDAVEAFQKSKKPKALFATVIGEGVDFPYDQARLQIIVKVPFPDLADPYVQAMMEKRGEEWYIWQAVKALEQAYGRIVRAEDDWGVTVCLDTNFLWLHRKYKQLFDPWFVEAVRGSTVNGVIADLEAKLQGAATLKG